MCKHLQILYVFRILKILVRGFNTTKVNWAQNKKCFGNIE
jgi:hypothetical protein